MKILREIMDKMEALRIAYMFTMQVIPNYKYDQMGYHINEAIKNNSTQNSNIIFFNDEDMSSILENYKDYCDFKNTNKRYILLHNDPTQGLICLLTILSRSVCIIMSEKSDYLTHDDFIVGINSIQEERFEIYNTVTALDKLYDKGYLQLYLNFDLGDTKKPQQLIIACKINDSIPIYNARRTLKYSNLLSLLNKNDLPTEPIIKAGLDIIGLKYTIPKSLYVEYNNVLFQLTAVDQYWVKTEKL